eukprot:Nk52_evm35s967 gene=Nk52_evmTU35s967
MSSCQMYNDQPLSAGESGNESSTTKAHTDKNGKKSSRSSSFKRNRFLHNLSEKDRRAHLKRCFSTLKDSIPELRDEDLRLTNIQIIETAAAYIQHMQKVSIFGQEQDIAVLENFRERLKKDHSIS